MFCLKYEVWRRAFFLFLQNIFHKIFRNPGTETVEEKIVLDRNIDVPEEIGTFYRCTYLDYKTENKEEIKKKVPFKYDNELKVTLIHGEYRI